MAKQHARRTATATEVDPVERDYAQAVSSGYGNFEDGLRRLLHGWLDQGDDPDSEGVLTRVVMVLRRHDPALDAREASFQAMDLVNRERRRSARQAEAEAYAQKQAEDVQDDDHEDVPPTSTSAAPAPVFPDAAMPGPWRRLVKLWEPWTEAHPASIVLPALIACGVHGAEGVRLGQQRAVEYFALVGPSTIGRKDTGVRIATDFAQLVGCATPKFGTAGSGEGIWYTLRDAEGDDPGVDDKRLLLVDTEMGGTLAAGHRSGSTVLPAMLSLWDTGSKQPLTKRDRLSVTDAHFSYIGLTTPAQFVRHVTLEDRENGFLQRLLIGYVLKVRDVPPSRAMNPDPDRQELEAVAQDVADRMAEAVSRGRRWTLSAAAAALLDAEAPELVDPARPETARAVPHVLRLAMLYALTVPPTDDDDEVRPGVVAPSHVRAAICAWLYCAESAAVALASDDKLEKLVTFARDAGDNGLSRSDVHRLFGNNLGATELEALLVRGRAQGRLREVVERTGLPGRRRHRILAV